MLLHCWLGAEQKIHKVLLSHEFIFGYPAKSGVTVDNGWKLKVVLVLITVIMVIAVTIIIYSDSNNRFNSSITQPQQHQKKTA